MAELPPNILGLECQLSIGPAGGDPGMEVEMARSVELSLTSAMADVTVRKSGWRLQRRALKEASIALELIYAPGNPVFDMLFESYNNGTPIAVFASDGFGSGLLCDGSVTEFSMPQPLEDAVIVNCTIVPTFVDRYPVWKKGSAAPATQSAAAPAAFSAAATSKTAGAAKTAVKAESAASAS